MTRFASSFALLTAVAVGGVFAAAGCATEEAAEKKEPVGGATQSEAGLEAKNFFIERVYDNTRGDKTDLKSGCGGCHSGNGGGGSVFLAATAEGTYARIEGSAGLIAGPGRSPLVNHLHQDKTISMTPQLRALLTQWLNLEATARGLEGGLKVAPTLAEAYKAFADCMNFDVWNYYRVGDLPFSQTDLEGPCMGCHATGQGGAYLPPASRQFFDKSKEFPFIQKFVVGQVNSSGAFEKLIPANRFVDKSNEICPDGKLDCHPTFGLAPNVQEGITFFIQTTLQNLAGGTCQTGVPTLVQDAGPRDGGKD